MFLETDIAHGMTFRGKQWQVFHKFTMHVDPGYKYIKKFRGRIQWYLMESKNFISNNNFKSKNENGNLVSINGQSIFFRVSIKEN